MSHNAHAKALPTVAEISSQWGAACHGHETELWSSGDSEHPNGRAPRAILTEAEKESYSGMLSLLRRYSAGLDAWGDDLLSKLNYRFSLDRRKRLEEYFTLEADRLLLDEWFELSLAVRHRLISAVD